MNLEVKIYCLYEPHTNKIRYIGRTRCSLKKRLREHLCKAKKKYDNCYKTNWINSLLKKGVTPKIRLLTVINGWKESHLFEKELIQQHFRKHNLVNGDDRGCGNLSKNTDEITEKERIKKIKTFFSKEENKNNFYNKVYVYLENGEFYKEYKSIKFIEEDLNIPKLKISQALSSFHNYNLKVNPIKGFYFSKFTHEKHPLSYNSKKYQTNHKEIIILDLKTNKKIVFLSAVLFAKHYNLNSWDLNQYRQNIFTQKFKKLLEEIEILPF